MCLQLNLRMRASTKKNQNSVDFNRGSTLYLFQRDFQRCGEKHASVQHFLT